MTLVEAKERAIERSLDMGGVDQHINFKVQAIVDDETVTGFFYVSDWYDSDCTVFSCSNGVEKF